MEINLTTFSSVCRGLKLTSVAVDFQGPSVLDVLLAGQTSD
jgi:hypothetical protein